MAENSAEIKKLIGLRRQRPSFSRMISWDMSQAAEQLPVKKTKQKKKKSSTQEVDKTVENDLQPEVGDEENVDEVAKEVSDSSDYDTACEDEEDLEGNTDEMNRTESDSLFDSIDKDILELEIDDDVRSDMDDSDVSDDELFMSSVSSISSKLLSTEGGESGRRRRLSKKQKRKRKKYFRMTYIEDLYNLGNLFDINNEISDVFTDVLASETSVDLKQRVPTLVELCLQVNRRKQRSNSERQRNTIGTKKDTTTFDIPYGMKKLLSSWSHDQKHLERQLSFFLNKVLPIAEEKVVSLHYVCETERYDDNCKRLVLQKRSAQSLLPYPYTLQMKSNVQYPSEKSAAFLYIPYLHITEENVSDLYYAYRDYYTCPNVALTNILWALATTIDLMLPSQVNTTSIIRVKRALSLRYKHLVERMFDHVLPYVIWARGKVAMATDMFRTLVEKETEVDTKAMYLSEIGRMHAIFGDTGTAEQFYRLATETAFEIDNSIVGVNQVTAQKQVLLASIYDIGVMDRDKCDLSCQYWRGVKGMPDVRGTMIIAGFDALLCYHITNCSDGNQYDEVLSRIEGMTESSNYLYYYQSMIHALKGADKSRQLYRECRRCCHHTPGEGVLALLGRQARNPWQPLVDIANEQKSEIKPLKVIWRTNLQAPRITRQGPMEAHINSKRLNLRQNEAGYITGDMQMTLPPLRDICLHPHTGYLVIDNIPSQTGTWMSAYFDPQSYHCYDLLVPTPVLLYSHEDGTTVQMMKPGNTTAGVNTTSDYSTNGPPCPFMLYWAGPDGQTAKVNLLTAFKKTLKEALLSTLKKNESINMAKWKFDESYMEKMYKFVDLAYERNFSLNESSFTSAIGSYQSRMKRVKKALKKGKSPKHSTEKILVRDFGRPVCDTYEDCILETEPFIYGKSIAIPVKNSKNHHYMFIVNTEDKSSFLSFECRQKSKELLNQGCRNSFTHEEYYIFPDHEVMNVLNQKGQTVLSILSTDAIAAAKSGTSPIIIYPHVYGTNSQKNSIWRAVIGLEPEVMDTEELVCWTLGTVFNELVSNVNKEITIASMTSIGEKMNTTGKLLMLNLVLGLGFINPSTMDFVSIIVKEDCAKHFEFTSENKVMKGDFENAEILAEKTFLVDNKPVCRTALGVQNKVFVLDLSLPHGDDSIKLEMICSLELPGFPKEICIVGNQVGMLISLTQHSSVDEDYYKEHVFYYDFNGYLHGVLLCLSRGPRSFLPVYLRGNEGSDDQPGSCSVSAGWHVYMRDGRDGILCVRL